jgi:hypothetical protein
VRVSNTTRAVCNKSCVFNLAARVIIDVYDNFMNSVRPPLVKCALWDSVRGINNE